MEMKNKCTFGVYDEYQQILFEGVMVKTDQKGEANVDLPYSNTLKSDKFLVKSLFGLSDKELKELDTKEYSKMLIKAKKELPDPLS